MKITKEQHEYIKGKNSYIQEGFVSKLFATILKKKLKNNSEFKKAVDNADKAAQDLRDEILKAEKEGISIPAGLKKYAGL